MMHCMRLHFAHEPTIKRENMNKIYNSHQPGSPVGVAADAVLPNPLFHFMSCARCIIYIDGWMDGYARKSQPFSFLDFVRIINALDISSVEFWCFFFLNFRTFNLRNTECDR